ncbi:MAG: BamA/TamA family outer membrane protein [Bacteroidia bacterium]|nr:BamA/TamA family outer membrane protein [Bacteroidia bacterium]
MNTRDRVYWCVLLWMICSTLPAFSQTDSVFKQVKRVETDFSDPSRLAKKIRRNFNSLHDSLEFVERKTESAAQAGRLGYREFSIDSFQVKGRKMNLHCHVGPRYFYHQIDLIGLSEVEFEKAGFTSLVKKRAPFDLDNLEGRLRLSLSRFQNSGYPFAIFDSLEVDFISAAPDTIQSDISYRFHPGNLVKIDSIHFIGNSREKDKFLMNLIDLHPGDLYNQKQIEDAPKVLNNSIYLRNVKPAKIEFDPTGKKAELTFEVEKRKAGKFDLLIGILPPTNPQDRKVRFTGLADFQLVSPLFKSGEILRFRYDKLVGTSQKLHIEYLHPNIAGTPLKGQFEFSLLKQDTLFLTRNLQISGYYAFNPNLSVRTWYKSRSSSLISTRKYENDSIHLPPILDATDQTYGIGFVFDNLDYIFNPTRGFLIKMDAGLGRKKIRINPKLHENLYSNLQLSTPKREATFRIDWYKKVFKRQVVHLANFTYWLDQPQYFENDLMQVGGAQLLRGFNENQFFTNLFTMFTAEYRYLLEQNSYIFLFGDYAYLENKVSPATILHPLGVGLGMAYETRAGVVSVTYAVGQAGNTTFQPSRGRIHVGLVNQF